MSGWAYAICPDCQRVRRIGKSGKCINCGRLDKARIKTLRRCCNRPYPFTVSDPTPCPQCGRYGHEKDVA